MGKSLSENSSDEKKPLLNNQEKEETLTKLREILNDVRDKIPHYFTREKFHHLIFGNTALTDEDKQAIATMHNELNKLLQKHNWLAFLLNSFQSVVTAYIGTQYVLPPVAKQGDDRKFYLDLGTGLIICIPALLISIDGFLLWLANHQAKKTAENNIIADGIKNTVPRDFFRKLIATSLNFSMIFSSLQILGYLFAGKTGAYYEFFIKIADKLDEMPIAERAGLLFGSIIFTASSVGLLKYLSRHQKMSQKRTSQIGHTVELILSPISATSLSALILLITKALNDENFGKQGFSKDFVNYFPIAFPIFQIAANIVLDHRESKSLQTTRGLSRLKRVVNAGTMETMFTCFTTLIAYNTVSLFGGNVPITFNNEDAIRIFISCAFTSAFFSHFVFGVNTLTKEADTKALYNVVANSDIIGSYLLTLTKALYTAAVFSNGLVYAYADSNFVISMTATMLASAGVTWSRQARIVPFKKLDSLAYEIALLRRIIPNNIAYASTVAAFSACDLAINLAHAKLPKNHAVQYLISIKHLLMNGVGGYIFANAFSSEYAWLGAIIAVAFDFAITHLEYRCDIEPNQGKALTASFARILFNIASILSMFLYDQPGNTQDQSSSSSENYNLDRFWSVAFVMATLQLILIPAMTNAITRNLNSTYKNDVLENNIENNHTENESEFGMNLVLENNIPDIENDNLTINSTLITQQKQLGLKPGYSARLFSPYEKSLDVVPDVVAMMRSRCVPRSAQ